MSDPSVEPPAQEFYRFDLWFEMAGDVFEAGPIQCELAWWPHNGALPDCPRSLVLRVYSNGSLSGIVPASGNRTRDQQTVIQWATDAINRRISRNQLLAAAKLEPPLLRQIAQLVVQWARASR